jgi:hypothetical protein
VEPEKPFRVRELPRRSAPRRSDIELQLAPFFTVGKKGDLGSIGRPGHAMFIEQGLAASGADVDGRAACHVNCRLGPCARKFHICHTRPVRRNDGLGETARQSDLG